MEGTFESLYPLHWIIWRNDPGSLEALLSNDEGRQKIEQRDPRSRTPLHLAVTLGRVECSHLLLSHGADATVENAEHWSVIQEAVCNGSAEVVKSVMQCREYQMAIKRLTYIPQLLQQLKEAPDFYIEMKWEITSWVPLMSRMCPSDTYRIWKKGANVRVDTSLLGFADNNWVRGNRTFIFHGAADTCTFIEVDHDEQTFVPQLLVVQEDMAQLRTMRPSQTAVIARLTSPVISTTLNTDNLSFSRQKSGIYGFRYDRVDTVNDFEAKVFAASGVDIVTRTRVEHLPEAERKRYRDMTGPLQGLMGGDGPASGNESEQGHQGGGGILRAVASISTSVSSVLTKRDHEMSAVDYFQPSVNEPNYHGNEIGRPMDMLIRRQSFKASLWLADDFPLSLREQVLPIIELMATNSTHFARLRDFVALQLPAGFPVKIEIPLFHVLSACVTFGNLNGRQSTAEGVMRNVRTVAGSSSTPGLIGANNRTHGVAEGVRHRRHQSSTDESSEEPLLSEERESMDSCVDDNSSTPSTVTESCTIADWLFEVPSGYAQARGGRFDFEDHIQTVDDFQDDDEQLLQLVIQQSLRHDSNREEVTIMEALRTGSPLPSIPTAHIPGGVVQSEDDGLQEALRASMMEVGGVEPAQPAPAPLPPHPSQSFQGSLSEEEQLRLVLQLSNESAANETRRRQEADDEELERVMRLSLLEK